METEQSNAQLLKEPDYKFELMYVLERAKNLARKFILGSISIIYHIAVIIWMSVELSRWHEKSHGTIAWDSLVLIFVSTLFFATIIFVIVQKRKFDEYTKKFDLDKQQVIYDAFDFSKKMHDPEPKDVKKALEKNEVLYDQLDLKAFKNPTANIFKKAFLKNEANKQSHQEPTDKPIDQTHPTN